MFDEITMKSVMGSLTTMTIGRVPFYFLCDCECVDLGWVVVVVPFWLEDKHSIGGVEG